MPRLLSRLSLLAALGLAAVAPGTALALAPINASFIGKVAIDGTDPVAYFTDGRPVEGSDDITFTWKGAVWRFATAEHRDLFKATPEKFAPQYGGYCAWAVSNGDTADIDPRAWKIVDGKLYLNYSLDVQKKWEADVKGNILKADANWPRLRDGT